MRLPWSPPDYAQRCLTNVLPSATAGLGGQPGLLPMPSAKQLIVILVDGLGLLQLRAAAHRAPFLASLPELVSGGIDSAFPSTTAVSLASLGTGLPPGQHGFVGASFWLPETDRVLFPLGWRADPHPTAVQPEPTIFEQSKHYCVTVSAAEFEDSGLTRAVLRGGDYFGTKNASEWLSATLRAVSVGAELVYAYLSEVDKAGHIFGTASAQWEQELAQADQLVAELAAALPKSVGLVVTADHGMVDVGDDDRYSIDGPEFRAGVRRIAGEPRVRHLYLEPGVSARQIQDRWQQLLGDAAVLATRDDLIEAGYFGAVDPELTERIGDVIALASKFNALTSMNVDSIVSSLRGQHGGLTEAERTVPLLGMTG